jgi:hypothetical protein
MATVGSGRSERREAGRDGVENSTLVVIHRCVDELVEARLHPGRSAREKFILSGSLKRTKASHLIYFYPQTLTTAAQDFD